MDDVQPTQPASGTVVRRLATVLQGVELDCDCRSRLDQALARFEALENRRSARQQLATARRQRERIEAVLHFLQDLDMLAPTEQDHGLYEEIALLFDDLAEAAAEGASAMRRLAASPVAMP
ncbi:hypothetical protein PV773_06790 [Mesorhizobium sp. CC13]|uniref:hypothetical protein n=1 Tax=Mesorhizobium sp. CC13 TaxID=3029194 RepID=UPI0032642464